MDVKPLDTKLLGELHEAVLAKITEVDFNDQEGRVEFLRSQAVTELLILCYDDTRAYAKVFYPDRFSLPFSELHDEVLAVIDAKDEKGEPLYKKIVIKAFRGFGKSSIAKTLVAKRARYIDTHFATYIGKSESFAMMQTESIKNSMIMNRLENFLFGPINPKSLAMDVDPSFSKKSWVTSKGVLVLPRGSGQPIRGLLHDWDMVSYRPSLFVIDDLEDPKYIDSEDYRDETYLWLLSDVVEAKPTPGVSTNWQIIYIDTLKHEDAVLQRIIDRDDWKYLDISLCSEDYKSRAPMFYTDKQIEEEVRQHKEAGTLDVFYREKMGVPIATEDAAFRKEYFRYYAEDDNIKDDGRNFVTFRQERPKLETIVIFDPAKTVKVHSAETGFVVISFNVAEHRIFIRYAAGLKLYPDEIYEHAFALARQYGASAIGYEETSLDEFIRKPIMDAMLKAGANYILEPLKARSGRGEFSGHYGGKKARIASMVPYYRRGEVYHNIVGLGALELQLLSFPKSKRWDIMDATAYFVEMLEKGGKYWMPGGAEYDIDGDEERAYRQLLAEDMETGELHDWRII